MGVKQNPQKLQLLRLLQISKVTMDTLDILCPDCGKGFKGMGPLKAHMTDIHVEETVRCDECGKDFKNPTRLKIHERLVHMKVDKNDLCDQCEKTFKNKADLYHHKQAVHSTEAVKCPICKIYSKNHYALRKHFRKCSKKSCCTHNLFECSICIEIYSKKKNSKMPKSSGASLNNIGDVSFKEVGVKENESEDNSLKIGSLKEEACDNIGDFNEHVDMISEAAGQMNEENFTALKSSDTEVKHESVLQDENVLSNANDCKISEKYLVIKSEENQTDEENEWEFKELQHSMEDVDGKDVDSSKFTDNRLIDKKRKLNQDIEKIENKRKCIASATECEFADSITSHLDESISIEKKVLADIQKERVPIDQSSEIDEGKDGEKAISKENIANRNVDEPYPLQCKHCGKPFLNNISLKKHLRNVHSPDRGVPIVCEVCSKEYNKFNIKEHAKIHSEVYKFECKVCDKKFSKNNLLAHMKRAHSKKEEEEERVICEI